MAGPITVAEEEVGLGVLVFFSVTPLEPMLAGDSPKITRRGESVPRKKGKWRWAENKRASGF